MLREEVSSTSHLDVCVQYFIQSNKHYSVHYSIHYSIKYIVNYIVKFSVQYSEQYIVKEANRAVFLAKLANHLTPNPGGGGQIALLKES